MKTKIGSLLGAAVLFVAAPALADGDLYIYNFGNYTNPDLITKFEKQYNVKVTQDDYDTNEAMLAKVRAGNSGYDIVVPSDNTVQIMVSEGLLEESNPYTMSNFKNMKPEYVDVYWDRGRHYTVPWLTGTTSFAVNTDVYKGDINTWAILFDPPAELRGRISMLNDMNAVIDAAERYLGVPLCNSNKEDLKKVNDLLVKAKPYWRTFSYDTIAKITSHDVDVAQTWSGAAWRMRQKMPSVKYAYPKEGLDANMDNAAILKSAPHMDNAKLFLNFLMEPENAALLSEFTRYNNGITGSDKFLPADFATSPEIAIPVGVKATFVPPCPQSVVAIYNQIWANVKK